MGIEHIFTKAQLTTTTTTCKLINSRKQQLLTSITAATPLEPTTIKKHFQFTLFQLSLYKAALKNTQKLRTTLLTDTKRPQNDTTTLKLANTHKYLPPIQQKITYLTTAFLLELEQDKLICQQHLDTMSQIHK